MGSKTDASASATEIIPDKEAEGETSGMPTRTKSTMSTGGIKMTNEIMITYEDVEKTDTQPGTPTGVPAMKHDGADMV